MVPIILENVAAGREITCLAKAMATYISYMTGSDEQGEAISIKDAHLEKLQALAQVAMTKGNGAAFLEGAFGSELSSKTAFTEVLNKQLVTAKSSGVASLLA